MSEIFISYRRQDSLCQAGRLYDHLCDRFGADRVFMDFSTIKPGDEWDRSIEDNVSSAKLVLAVLGKEWVRISGADGNPRLRDPKDWVHREIAAALNHHVRIVPTLVQGASMPPEAELPEDLRPLLKRQAVSIGDVPFGKDVDGLVESVRSYVEPISEADHELVIGQVIVDHGGHHSTVHIGSPYGAVLAVTKQNRPTRIDLLPGPVLIRPEAPANVLDRQSEWKGIQTAIRSGAALQLFGEDGAGKTVLLQKAATDAASPMLRDGIVYLPAFGTPASDILQELFEAFSPDVPAYQPSDARLREALQGIRALIVIDDFEVTAQELNQVRGAVPSSVFLTASEARVLAGRESIEIHALPDDDAILLLEEAFGSKIGADRETAREICRILNGHPLRIAQVGLATKERRWPLPEALRELRSGSPETFVIESFAGDLQIDSVLSVLAAMNGAPLTAEHLNALVPDASGILDRLVACAVIQMVEGGYRVCRNLIPAIRKRARVEDWAERLLGYFTAWARALVEEPRTITAAAIAIVAVLRLGAALKLHAGVLRLVRAVEGALAVGRRWGFWEIALRSGLDAARQLNDRSSEAWALHQLGTRSAALGMTRLGREQLTEALHIRESLATPAAADLTRRNLIELDLLEALQLAAPPSAEIPASPVVQPIQQPWYRRWPVLVGAAILLLLIILVLDNISAGSATQNTRVSVANPVGGARPVVQYFYVTQFGGFMALRWWVDGATRIRITPPPGGNPDGRVPPRGEQRIPGTPGVTYRLIFEGPDGKVNTAETVAPRAHNGPLQIISFYPLPPIISSQQPALLCWQTTGREVSLSPGNLKGLAPTGCIPMKPGQTTTYTLNTTNNNWSWPNPFRSAPRGGDSLPSSIVVDPAVPPVVEPQGTSRLRVDPIEVNFGDTASGTRDIALTNVGSSPLRLSISLVQNTKSAFTLRPGACSGKQLSPDEMCSITVQFHPAFGGEHAAMVKILSGDNGEWGAYLSGSWKTGPPLPVEDLTYPKLVTFAPLPVAQPTKNERYVSPTEKITTTVTISEQERKPARIVNKSDRAIPLGVASIDVKESDFNADLAGCSSVTLEPGKGCSIWISYVPSPAGRNNALLRIDRKDKNEKIEIRLRVRGPAAL